MIAFLGRLIRVLGILLLVRLVLRALAAEARRGPGAAAAKGGGAQELVRDRVCNTFVPRERALRARVAGRDEFFCGAACRDRALRDGGLALPAP